VTPPASKPQSEHRPRGASLVPVASGIGPPRPATFRNSGLPIEHRRAVLDPRRTHLGDDRSGPNVDDRVVRVGEHEWVTHVEPVRAPDGARRANGSGAPLHGGVVDHLPGDRMRRDVRARVPPLEASRDRKR
jgi:hypothetical protein